MHIEILELKCHVCNELLNGSEKERRKEQGKYGKKKKKRNIQYIGEEERERGRGRKKMCHIW